MELHSAGENAMMLYLGDETSPAVSARVQAAAVAIEAALAGDLVDLVPSYASLLIVYDPLCTDHLSVSHRVRQAMHNLTDGPASEGHTVTLPVYYAPEAGEDLEQLAELARPSKFTCKSEVREVATLRACLENSPRATHRVRKDQAL